MAPPTPLRIADVELRRLLPADRDVLVASMRRSRDHLRQWEPWAEPEATPERQAATLAWFDGLWDRGESFVYGCWIGDQFAGSSGLWSTGDRAVRTIGYWTDVEHTTRGIAGYAATALTWAGFQLAEVDAIEIHCDIANQVSARIPQRLGYRLVDTKARVLGVPAEAGRALIFRMEKSWFPKTYAWRRWVEEHVT